MEAKGGLNPKKENRNGVLWTYSLFPSLNCASSWITSHFLLHPMTVSIYVSMKAITCFVRLYING